MTFKITFDVYGSPSNNDIRSSYDHSNEAPPRLWRRLHLHLDDEAAGRDDSASWSVAAAPGAAAAADALAA